MKKKRKPTTNQQINFANPKMPYEQWRLWLFLHDMYVGSLKTIVRDQS